MAIRAVRQCASLLGIDPLVYRYQPRVRRHSHSALTKSSRSGRCARLNDMASVLCGSVDNPTDEDVIPKWLLRAFHAQAGSIIVSVAEEYGEQHQVKALKRFQITLDGGLCKKCNNERLGGLEQAVQHRRPPAHRHHRSRGAGPAALPAGPRLLPELHR
jgi:hypothetical protein